MAETNGARSGTQRTPEVSHQLVVKKNRCGAYRVMVGTFGETESNVRYISREA